MDFIEKYLRRALATRGLELRRIDTPMIRFADFIGLQSRRSDGGGPSSIHVFDDDPRLQAEIIDSFGQARVCFHPNHPPPPAGVPARSEPPLSGSGRFWVVVNGERYSVRPFFDEAQWARAADAFIVRCSLASLSPPSPAFADLVETSALYGLHLHDLAFVAQPVRFNIPNARVFLLFCRTNFGPESDRFRQQRLLRLDEASAMFPNPLALAEQHTWLVGRGSLGFEAGVFNPGALLDGSSPLLLARGESVPWPLQAQSEQRHFSGWCPLLLWLDLDNRLVQHTKLDFKSLLSPSGVRVEDFRLFRFRDRILSNHSIITLPDDREPQDQPVRLDLQHARVGISEVAPAEHALNFIGFPQLDLNINRIEKNWAMLESGSELFLIYSVSPYRVLRAVDWPGLVFKTEINEAVQLPFARDGRLVRNSVNPVVYDENHFLHLVHKVYPNKQYVYWALLLDRRTLRPAFVSRRPLVRSGPSLPSAILYVCSVIAYPDRVVLFAGINDCGTGAWQLSRSALDGAWQKLPEA